MPNKEDEVSEIPDFSEIGGVKSTKAKSGIPTESYNRKVLTYSELLGETVEKLTGKNIGEVFTATLLNTIGETNVEVRKFLVKNQNLTREFSKPTTIKDANKKIVGLNKVREWLNTNHNVGLRMLTPIVEKKE